MIDTAAEVIFNREVAEKTFFMGLRSREIAAEALPGQFVMIKVRPGYDPLLRRPFSICRILGREGLVLILYRVVGKGTGIMSAIDAGKTLSVMGPLGGGFNLPRPGEKALLAAGGIGIAPLVCLSHAMEATEEETEFMFMAGYGSSVEIVPEYEVGLSEGSMMFATDDGSAGHKGVVTDLLESCLNDATGPLRIMACGPLPMLRRVAGLALERHIPCQVSLEATMACGIGACQGCVVKASLKETVEYYHVCHDGPVFDALSIEWEAI